MARREYLIRYSDSDAMFDANIDYYPYPGSVRKFLGCFDFISEAIEACMGAGCSLEQNDRITIERM